MRPLDRLAYQPKPLLPEWRWWPALPFATLVLLASHALVWELSLASLTAQNRNPPTETRADANPETKEGGADERIVGYTLWLTIFTGALAAVSAGQIRYLIRADRATKRALDQSKEATEIELRPYIAPGVATLHSDPSGGGKMFARVKLTNVGKTPASDMVVSVGLSIQTWPQTSVVRTATMGGVGPQITRMELWPANDARAKTNGINVSRSALEEVDRSEAAIVLGGTLQYRDVFGMRHTTHFSRHKIGESWRDGEPMDVSPRGNESISERVK